jgi:hypothetical protein
MCGYMRLLLCNIASLTKAGVGIGLFSDQNTDTKVRNVKRKRTRTLPFRTPCFDACLRKHTLFSYVGTLSKIGRRHGFWKRSHVWDLPAFGSGHCWFQPGAVLVVRGAGMDKRAIAQSVEAHGGILCIFFPFLMCGAPLDSRL